MKICKRTYFEVLDAGGHAIAIATVKREAERAAARFACRTGDPYSVRSVVYYLCPSCGTPTLESAICRYHPAGGGEERS